MTRNSSAASSNTSSDSVMGDVSTTALLLAMLAGFPNRLVL
jgi:hypothetical protein